MCDFIVSCMIDGDLSAIKRYINGLISVNDYVYEDGENCLNLLHLATGLDCDHRESIIELLIDSHANLDCPGKSENVNDVRALHIAAMWGYDSTVKSLLYHGADASLRDENNLSPVDYASIFDNYLCISLLLRHSSLNATASAWSAIMDSSFGETQVADSSFDGSTHNQSLEGPVGRAPRFPEAIASSSTTRPASRISRPGETSRSRNDPNLSREEKIQKLREDVLELSNRVRESINLAREDGDNNVEDEYDPFRGLNESEVNRNLLLDNRRLRLELCRLGRRPGPITDTTKTLYAKLLTKLIEEDKELVYSPRTKTNSQLNGYSNELNSIITGKFSIKQALELEKELIRISGTRDYHGPKQFFNYILIDPRISQNLPELAMEGLSDSDTSSLKLSSPTTNLDNGRTLDANNNNNCLDKNSHKGNNGNRKRENNPIGKLNRKFNPQLFTKFIESIFYIGKGQKKRDLMHLYDALADRGSITKSKIDRIRSIWDDGHGVVSLHLFHNITSKEALTREAVMIETIGLTNLTNLIKGTIQFKLGWNEHKRRQLGALLLHRAYTQFLNEGERQLHKDDLKYKS